LQGATAAVLQAVVHRLYAICAVWRPPSVFLNVILAHVRVLACRAVPPERIALNSWQLPYGLSDILGDVSQPGPVPPHVLRAVHLDAHEEPGAVPRFRPVGRVVRTGQATSAAPRHGRVGKAEITISSR